MFVSVITLLVSPSYAQEQQVYVIPLEGEVGVAMEQFVAVSINELEGNPDVSGVIFTLDTYGGRVDSAERISDMITGLEFPTAAYVNPRAISAGVLLTISADHIAMAPGSNIGSAETIPDTEKALSAWTGVLRSVAQEKGRDPELVASMADQSIEIEDVVASGKLLNLTASEALELGLSDMTAANINEVTQLMGMNEARLVEIEISRTVRLAQILTSTYVAPVLLSIGFIGFMIEILDGATRRNRIPMRVNIPTLTPEKKAVIQSPMGTKLKNTEMATMTTATMIIKPINPSIQIPLLVYFFYHNPSSFTANHFNTCTGFYISPFRNRINFFAININSPCWMQITGNNAFLSHQFPLSFC